VAVALSSRLLCDDETELDLPSLLVHFRIFLLALRRATWKIPRSSELDTRSLSEHSQLPTTDPSMPVCSCPADGLPSLSPLSLDTPPRTLSHLVCGCFHVAPSTFVPSPFKVRPEATEPGFEDECLWLSLTYELGIRKRSFPSHVNIKILVPISHTSGRLNGQPGCLPALRPLVGGVSFHGEPGRARKRTGF
jgi:hypothetical protein